MHPLTDLTGPSRVRQRNKDSNRDTHWIELHKMLRKVQLKKEMTRFCDEPEQTEQPTVVVVRGNPNAPTPCKRWVKGRRNTHTTTTDKSRDAVYCRDDAITPCFLLSFLERRGEGDGYRKGKEGGIRGGSEKARIYSSLGLGKESQLRWNKEEERKATHWTG